MLKISKILSVKPVVRGLVAVVLAAGVLGGVAVVHADRYDEAIKALNKQNARAQGVLNGLESQASSYQDAINKYQVQIDAIRAQLAANEADQAKLQHQIIEAQHKLAQQKKYLAEDIRTMYTDGQLSTIEELATSKNLSDYVDKEEYRTSVQNKIDATIQEIAALQAELQDKKHDLDLLIASQREQNSRLSDAQSEQQNLLSFNQGQQSAYNSQISSNSSKIAELRREQIAANSRFIGAAGSGPACGGGYPAKWCEIPQDSVLDNWGMYNRECVSYTAFRVAASGRKMPYWGGRGNANQWDDNARADGIPVDGHPHAGDVAISNAGAYGHAMYVEGVNGDGTINISQYNAALDGRYSTRYGLDPGYLVFIHF